jgi:oligopeptide transport system substrate-binding protein
VPDADVISVLSDPTLASEVRRSAQLTTFWMQINTAQPPLDNPLVRKALSKAIDREALVRDIASGLGLPATSILPPGMPGYQEGLGVDSAFDPQGGRDLLAKAGYPNGQGFPTLTFSFGTTPANERRAEFIQEQLRRNLGIAIRLQSVEPKAFQAAFKAKQYQLSFGGWGADYPDPQDWLGANFGCKGSNNKYGYCNATFDQLVDRADTSTDQDGRLALYAEAQRILVDDLPVVPLYYQGQVALVKPWVQSLTITGLDDYPGDFFLDQVLVTS